MNRVLLGILLIAPFSVFAHDSHDSESQLYNHVHTDELKKMMDSGNALIILDARTKDRDDKNRLPGSHFLPYNSPDAEIKALIPNQDAVIVVYCSNIRCPESTFLSERLATLGYKHVYKYPEGLNDWIKKGYKIDHAQ